MQGCRYLICSSLPQPVHSPSPVGLCGVGPVTSPGPLFSPGSSSDSNGADAEGPGPPAPVSVLLLHPSSLPFPCPWNQHCQSQRSSASSPLLFFLALRSSWPPRLPTSSSCTVLPWAPDTGQDPSQCCPLPFSVPQVTFQQICKDVHLVKHQGQQLFIESRARPLPRPRLPGELVGVWVWVRGETRWSPDLHPNPEELSPLLLSSAQLQAHLRPRPFTASPQTQSCRQTLL